MAHFGLRTELIISDVLVVIVASSWVTDYVCWLRILGHRLCLKFNNKKTINQNDKKKLKKKEFYEQ